MLRFPDNGGVNNNAVWRRRWPPRSKGPTNPQNDWSAQDSMRAEREIVSMCREAARRFAGGPQRARRRRKSHFDAEESSPGCKEPSDFEGGATTMAMRRHGVWPHFGQSNVNSGDEQPKVKSWPWQKKKKDAVAGKPPVGPGQAGAKGKPAGAGPNGAAAKTAGPVAPVQPNQEKKAEEAAKSAVPAKVASAKSETEAQPKPVKPPAEQKAVQEVRFSPSVEVPNVPGDTPYPVVSHYQMPLPGQFSYPYQLPISSQPILLPDAAEEEFCHHCGRGADQKKAKKKEKNLDMDAFLADVERKLTGKLQMQEMFMRELEEHYHDTLVTRSPPPCRRSHTDNESESETEETASHRHLYRQLEGHLPHSHSHGHHHQKDKQHRHQLQEDQKHRHQHRSKKHSKEAEELVSDHDRHRHHPNQHPRPCLKATQRRQAKDLCDRSSPFSDRTSSIPIRIKKDCSDETPSSSCASRRHDDSTSGSSSQRRSSHQKKHHAPSHSKSSSAQSSEEKGSKFRSQLEIVTSQLPCQERSALRRSLASLRARKEDTDLDKELDMLERELFAGSENVEWEQQLCLDSPTARMKMKDVEANEDRLLHALYNEQNGFTDDDLMSEPEPV